MSDPQHFGLGELGQRVQAMSDPVAAPAKPAAGSIPDRTSKPKSGRAASRPAAAPLPGGSAAHRLALQPRTASVLRASRRPPHPAAQPCPS